MELRAWAESEATDQLAALSRRLTHTRAVAGKTVEIACLAGGAADLLVAERLTIG